jgi:glycosyltransferase involved in cell wall biosynthesis
LNGDYPLISVIIPTLNEEKLIPRVLAQFTQDLKDKYHIELVISDGGSTDTTLSIVDKIADKIITPAPAEKQNISIGRNAGGLNASGNYLCFINADTVINNPNHFFEKAINAFEDAKILAVTFKVKVFPEEEKLVDKIFHSIYNNYVFILNKFGIGMGRGECQMMRKSVYLQVGGYNESTPAGEDFDLYRRIRKLGKIKYIRDLTVFESPRRYRKEGYLKVFWNWTINSLSVFFLNKAVSKKWESVR